MKRGDPTALVTGGAGFIGSHLVDRLIADGFFVEVIDDLSTGSIGNLKGASETGRLRFVESKVSEDEGLSDRVQEADFVFHLAAAVGVELVVQKPAHTIRTNLMETDAILEAAGATSTPLILASTSEVYGKSARERFSESDDLLIGRPDRIRWGYACSKLMDEFMAMAVALEQRLPVTIARLFNTVGPRQTGQYGMVLPRFIEAALTGAPLKVYGDGQQTRTFCFVDDTVEALLRLMRLTSSRGEVVNIGGAEEISIEALAQRVVQVLDSSSAIERLAYDQVFSEGFEDMRRRRPDVDKLHRLTGFRPGTPVDEMIRRTAVSIQAARG